MGFSCIGCGLAVPVKFTLYGKRNPNMGNSEPQKFIRYRWIIFWVLSGGYILVYFHRLCPAVVAVDMMQDLKTGGTLTGLLSAAYFYPYAVMQLPAGLLSDSWGPRKTITIFFLVASGGSVLLGVAPSAAWALAGRALVGIGVAMLFVPTMKILAEWFRVGEFAVMTGILMAVGGLGSLIAAAPLAWLSVWIGWRLSFVVVGAFTLVLAALVWMVVRDRPADLGWPSPAEHLQSKAEPIALLEGMRRVVGCRAFWPLAVWFFFDCAVFFSFGGLWGGPYLIQVHQLSKDQAASVLSMLAVGMMVGSPLLSYASNSIFRARKPVLVLSSLITAGITALLAFRTAQVSPGMLVAMCFGLGLFSERHRGDRVHRQQGTFSGSNGRNRHRSGEPVSVCRRSRLPTGPGVSARRPGPGRWGLHVWPVTNRRFWPCLCAP